MNEQTARDNETLIEFWGQTLALPEEARAEISQLGPDEFGMMAPAEKILNAARSLGACKKALDYGCGYGWAAIAAAKSGCPDVTAADPAQGAVDAAAFLASHFQTADRVHPICAAPDWLRTVPDNTYDGFFCSNVLDVVPPETAEEIVSEAARVVTPDATVVIGLNYWLSEEAAAEKGLALTDGCLYLDGVLRLVSRTDAEWSAIFAPYFTVERLECFAWEGEQAETRRLFFLKKR